MQCLGEKARLCFSAVLMWWRSCIRMLPMEQWWLLRMISNSLELSHLPLIKCSDRNAAVPVKKYLLFCCSDIFLFKCDWRVAPTGQIKHYLFASASPAHWAHTPSGPLAAWTVRQTKQLSGKMNREYTRTTSTTVTLDSTLLPLLGKTILPQVTNWDKWLGLLW